MARRGPDLEVAVMEFTLEITYLGWAILIVGALAFGVIAQFVGETRTGYEWAVDAVGAFIGALVASEFVIAWQAFEPVYEGVALVPALIGGLVVGIAVDIVTRYMTGGRYLHAPV
ncbi:MAG TPA: hypothetical protein VFR93_00055 [Candidatus Limnocylindrales bacterium]|nr:hypothetical protein [Candidatus Limnocylindrales bacterium]